MSYINRHSIRSVRFVGKSAVLLLLLISSIYLFGCVANYQLDPEQRYIEINSTIGGQGYGYMDSSLVYKEEQSDYGLLYKSDSSKVLFLNQEAISELNKENQVDKINDLIANAPDVGENKNLVNYLLSRGFEIEVLSGEGFLVYGDASNVSEEDGEVFFMVSKNNVVEIFSDKEEAIDLISTYRN